MLLCRQLSQLLEVNILRLVKFDGKDPTYHMLLDQGIIVEDSPPKVFFHEAASPRAKQFLGRILSPLHAVES